MTAGSHGYRVLLVEDDDDVAGVVLSGLSAARFRIDRAGSVDDARRCLQHSPYDVIVLDLLLPDGSGLKVAEAIRATGSDVPIVMLTSRDSVDQRVEGLARGADDYVCKPFAIEELDARLQAVLRRSRGRDGHVLRWGDVQLDLIKRIARRGQIVTELSSREADLLAYLMRHPDEKLSREKILEDVWGDDADYGGNVLNVYVNYLRNKLERGVYPRIIHTIRGTGYMFSETDPAEAG